jgi:plasmid stabilization system protein ParE
MAQVIYSDEALADFERIVEFLLESSRETAMQALTNIRSAVAILEVHPLIGRRVDDHIRELVISQRATGYLALYRFDAAFDVIRILRIRHQREAGYAKSSVPGFMDLHLDILERSPRYRRIAIGHYWKHPSGDMIPDPDMTIPLFFDRQLAEALTYGYTRK